MSSKYVDITSVIQVIGNVFNNPELLDINDKYKITEDDFTTEFHKIVFGSIYKLHELGAKEVTIENIVDFLSSRPKSEVVFTANKGVEWISTIINNCSISSFDYYYNRLKKFTLLRAYDNIGLDITDIYDIDNITDFKKKQLQEEKLDNTPIEKLADIIDDKISSIREKYVDSTETDSAQAGEGIYDLIESFKGHPEVGVPLYGPLINTVVRGARLKKFYLRSAPSGYGKSRTMIADACYIACSKIYDSTFGTWISCGASCPTVFITTEQTLDEVQTMMLSFISNVNEEHILNGLYQNGEEERVLEAADVLSKAPLYIEQLPDFSLQDVENTIKKNIREHNARYIIYDYIHTSMKILEEITKRSGGVRLREDNILFMLSNKLKDICNLYSVFILSATQLNGTWQDSEIPDQNLLRGAKSIADWAKE